MHTSPPSPDRADSNDAHVAVIGAGVAGASCCAGLLAAAARVTVFERSRHTGGRLAERQADWTDAAGIVRSTTFDHGTTCFTASQPRFRKVMARAVAGARAAPWQPLIHAARSAACVPSFVTLPATPGFCDHLLAGATLRLGCNVRRLQRAADGAWFVASDGAPLEGPFSHVVLAVTPARAAVLLAGHHDAWATAVQARRMEPCWTLMAVTDEVDWPWNAAEPDRGPLRWVARNDRLLGRTAPAGLAVWVAHATAEWSAPRLDAEPAEVKRELQAALRAQLPANGIGDRPWRWHHVAAHRWSHAGPAPDCGSFDGGDAWWDDALGVGLCGDWFGGGGVEAAWQSGDELADAMSASFERADGEPPAKVALPPAELQFSKADGHLVTG